MQNISTIKTKITLCLFAVLTVTQVCARRPVGSGSVQGTSSNATPAAGCAAAVALSTLQFNNVRCRIEASGGSMWQDRANSIADYEIPRRSVATDPKFSAIYAGALWMGGQDVNGQLKLAAVTFRTDGNDFWPGPLNTTTAEIDPATCTKYDRFYGVSQAMVVEFVAWHQAGVDDNDNGTTTQIDDFPGYQIPDEILDWPAHGDISLGQDWHLAPFFDADGDDFYDPNSGDYPKYDLIGDIDCRVTRDVRLFGDTTIWFVFNDKGNVHSESQGPSIGMEIRGQAFAFATDDEVNDMTFYNYEMINRSTFTLTETYFGQWVDADLGNSGDDFVGCDAQRGLGYCYNGDPTDENANGIEGYGTTPPAIGVDFFEGPYADNDGIDNPLTTNIADAILLNGIPYAGLGIGYGDSIIDNERYGMKKFVYYSNGGAFAGDGDPSTALDYYNYLRGKWRNGGANMVWGGNGNAVSTGGTILADLLFPGDSDPLFWSTQGQTPTPLDWSEFNALGGGPNPVGDRRFLESAGPFTLEPGAVNDLTVGVVWARAVSGDNTASISSLRVADDKAQALFDNCFKIAEGPDAPNIAFQELDRELILYLSNGKVSNNYNESYYQKNPFIAIPDTMDGVYQGTDADKDTLKYYDFQGYQIYQVKNGLITVGERYDPAKARLAAQVDIKDGVTNLVNYTYNEEFGFTVPQAMVVGADEGIKHSFRFTTDLFASGDNRLVNHKTYYYIAVAYGYNEFKKYDGLDPLSLDGQTLPYIGSRKMGGGQGIRSFSAIPHSPIPENGGTIAHSKYGDQPQITRLEGQGNGGNELELTASSEASIVASNFMNHPTYQSGKGPIQVKVVDPLNVKGGVYKVQFVDSTADDLGDATWKLVLPNGGTIDSEQSIGVLTEQLFLDEGLSVTIKQGVSPGDQPLLGNGYLTSSVEYGDPALAWLGGFQDQEGLVDANWIRSGSAVYDIGTTISAFNDNEPIDLRDPEQSYEGILDKTWAPYRLVSILRANAIAGEPVMVDAPGYGRNVGGTHSVFESKLIDLASVNIVFTSNKDQWTRCMVFEAKNDVNLSEGGAAHMNLRASPSVDKAGRNSSQAGYNSAEGDLTSTTSMGWFPGYAVNLETGERLNMAFAEDTWLAGENGRDMKWNPTSRLTAGVNGELMMGGKHYVYVFRSGDVRPDANSSVSYFSSYDHSADLYAAMSAPAHPIFDIDKVLAFSTCIWAGIPMVEPGHSLLETTATVKLRVEKPYDTLATAGGINGALPYYQFDMSGMEVETGNQSALDSMLIMINVVPNPYYAYSAYETGKLDNRIKITNLPEECTISMYNINGTLMRRFQKSDSKTSLDWDLKNHIDIPIASGVYLIHVLVPDVGERTLKWYGLMKPTDLNGF